MRMGEGGHRHHRWERFWKFGFGVDFPGIGFWFGRPWWFGFRFGPWPWGFPDREEYRRMLEDYKRDLEEYRRELDEELRRVEEELERLREG